MFSSTIKDEIKIEKTSNRINELEHINNNMKLLNEMLLNYNHATAIESERETIKVGPFLAIQHPGKNRLSNPQELNLEQGLARFIMQRSFKLL